MEERKYYLDNIRWIFILALIPFHAAMAWNNWGEGNYIKFGSSVVLSSFIYILSPWYMPMLFVIAGMSTNFSLRKRSFGVYIVERIKKLFIPLVAGLVTVAALMAYLGDCFNKNYTGNFFSHYKIFFSQVTDSSGYDGFFTPAHLWFLLFLFVISLIAVPLCLLIKKLIAKYGSTGTVCVSKFSVILLLGLIPIILRPIVPMGDKSVGSFIGFFVLGYFFAESTDVTIASIAKHWILLTVLFICLTVFDIYCNVINTYFFETILSTKKIAAFGIDNIKASDFIRWFIYLLTGWIGILFWLSIAPSFLNINDRVTRYLSKISFLFYIFHFPCLVIFQYLFAKIFTNTAALYLLPIIPSYIASFAVIEIVRHIPGVRFLFGVKKG